MPGRGLLLASGVSSWTGTPIRNSTADGEGTDQPPVAQPTTDNPTAASTNTPRNRYHSPPTLMAAPATDLDTPNPYRPDS